MKKALLIGINSYPNAPLRGCVNDVNNLANYLYETKGFSKEEIRLLVDERATTAAIKERLKWLVSDAKAGDQILFHYSGHGAQVSTRNAAGEHDALHDVICPVDFDFTADRMITDLDFWEIFKAIPDGVQFSWISDSCHSGDLTRDLFAMIVGRGYQRPRSYPVPPDVQWSIDAAKERGLRSMGLEGAAEHLNGAFIAACKSDQTSQDAFIAGNYCGAHTHFFIAELQGDKGASLSINEVIKAVEDDLSNERFTQIPQYRGDPSRATKPFLS